MKLKNKQMIEDKISNYAFKISHEAREKQIAIKLLDGIDKLYESPDISSRRWIFELLQNAKDIAEKEVKIEIEFDKNYLEFRHNGKPFLIENIVYLIEQISSKERAKELNKNVKTTGKFGTGFITTHLLSKKVNYFL